MAAKGRSGPCCRVGRGGGRAGTLRKKGSRARGMESVGEWGADDGEGRAWEDGAHALVAGRRGGGAGTGEGRVRPGDGEPKGGDARGRLRGVPRKPVGEGRERPLAMGEGWPGREGLVANGQREEALVGGRDERDT